MEFISLRVENVGRRALEFKSKTKESVALNIQIVGEEQKGCGRDSFSIERSLTLMCLDFFELIAIERKSYSMPDIWYLKLLRMNEGLRRAWLSVNI